MKHYYLNLRRLTAMAVMAFLVSLAVSGQATLMHSYDFEDGTVSDGTGTAHGSLNGAAEIVDGSVNLTGGFVSLPGKQIDVPSYGSVTVEAVFEQAAGLGGFTVMYGFGETNPDADWMGINYFIYQPTRNDNDNSRFSISCLNTTDPWATETGINAPKIGDTNKHYVVTIITATEMKLYLDGVHLGTETLTGNNSLSNVSNDTAYIGRSPYPNDPMWQGTVHELNVYKGELDEATILQNTETYLGAAFIDASLASLSTNPGTLQPAFDKNTDTYEIYVPYGTTSVDIDAVASVSGANIAMYDGLGNLLGADGVVTFGEDGIDVEIIVTSISGASTQSYFLSIFLDPGTASDRLSDITLSVGDFIGAFHPDITHYTVLVPRGTTSVDVTGIPMWSGATVQGGGTVQLTNGTGTTTITVTSEDGNFTNDYIVEINESVIETGVDYYIVNEASDGFVVTESGEAYNLIRLRWPESDNPAQLFRLEASGVEGQYFLRSGTNNYLTLTKTPVWDMIMTPTLTTDLDSCRFVINEFEPGRFRVQSVARLTLPNHDMGPNNPPNDGQGIYSDKSPTDQLATWNIMLPDNVVDPYNTFLDTLGIDGITVKPGFAFYRTEYFITLPQGTTSLDILATPVDGTATVTGAGTVDVTGDEGTITVTVTATDNTYSTDYLIHYQVDPGLSLMHSYTFTDGTAQDQVGDLDGMANDGSVVNGSFISDEEGDYLRFDPVALDLASYPSITLEAYVTTGENPGWTMLAYFGDLRSVNSYWMSIARNDNISMTEFNVSGAGATNIAGTEPGVGENHHYVSVLTNDTLYWYIDGTLAGKNALGPDMLINAISDVGAWLCYGGWSDPTWRGSVHEFNIYAGQMDETTVATRAINFPVEDETTNASLADIMIDGVSLATFHSLILDYEVTLEAGNPAVPVVTATATNANATVTVTPATELPGTTVISITAEDGTTTVEYEVNFVFAASNVATLSDLAVDGTTVGGFSPDVTVYNVIVPDGTTTVPAVTATPTNGGATVAITDATSIPGTTTVAVTASDGVTTITYSVNFKFDLSSDATLSGLTYDGTAVPGFSADVTAYSVTLPTGTTAVPTVVGTPTNEAASVVVTPAASLPGTTTIVVTAEDGETTKTYSVYFDVDVSVASRISDAIKLYPSVTDREFTLETPVASSSIRIIDITGKLVHEDIIESTHHQFSLQHAGMYIVKVNCEGVTKMFKIVKTN